MNQNKERQGEIIIFSEALLWSLFPVVTLISYRSVSSLISMSWSTLFGALFFFVVLCVKRSWHELKIYGAYKDILLGTVILGICYYFLFFFGLQHTSAGNAAILLPTEILFTHLFFRKWNKDPLSRQHTIGAFLMFIGAIIVAFHSFGEFHWGDLFILTASAIAPIGNFF